MHNFRKIILHTISIILLVAILLSVSVIPYFNREKFYYQDYKVRESLKGKLDTLVVGSSHALRSIKPTVLNKEMNIKSYNLSSPLMSMYGRYVLLKKEIDRNPIETVIIELSYNALILDRKNLGFEGDIYVLGRLDNTTERLKFAKEAFTIDEYDDVISDTIKRSKYALGDSTNTVTQYEAYGYIPVPSNDYSLTQEEKNKIINTETLDSQIKEENLEYFDSMIKLCKKNDIKIILVVTPVTEKMILRHNNIDEVFSQYKDLARKYNCEYYDFNLDKKRFDLYSEKTSFYDQTHMSDSGADIFSTRMSEILKNSSKKEDAKEEFYESYEELKETILKQNGA